jgi:hypothetical protein
MNSGFRCGKRNPELVGELFPAKAVELSQGKGMAILSRQRFDNLDSIREELSPKFIIRGIEDF